VRGLGDDNERMKHVGKKVGEIRMFRTKDHKVMAYRWDESGWVAIGEVTG
jgi:hypothetical protein